MANSPAAFQLPAAIAGNLQGTLAGLVTMVAAGFVANASFVAPAAVWLGQSGLAVWLAGALTAAGYVGAAGLIAQPAGLLGLLAGAIAGSAVNYFITHYAMGANLAKLYAALPGLVAEYQPGPNEVTTPSKGAANGNYNKG